MAIAPNVPNPKYADLTGVGIAALVLVSILLITRFAKGFVAGGVVLLLLGLLPKMAALVESLPTVVLGRAGLMMFGMGRPPAFASWPASTSSTTASTP